MCVRAYAVEGKVSWMCRKHGYQFQDHISRVYKLTSFFYCFMSHLWIMIILSTMCSSKFYQIFFMWHQCCNIEIIWQIYLSSIFQIAGGFSQKYLKQNYFRELSPFNTFLKIFSTASLLKPFSFDSHYYCNYTTAAINRLSH